MCTFDANEVGRLHIHNVLSTLYLQNSSCKLHRINLIRVVLVSVSLFFISIIISLFGDYLIIHEEPFVDQLRD